MKLIKFIFDSRVWQVISQQYGMQTFDAKRHLELSRFIAENDHTRYVIQHFCAQYRYFIIDTLNYVHSLLDFDEDLNRRLPFDFKFDFNYILNCNVSKYGDEYGRVKELDNALIELLEIGPDLLDFFNEKAERKFIQLQTTVSDKREDILIKHLLPLYVNTCMASRDSYIRRVINGMKFIWRNHDQLQTVV